MSRNAFESGELRSGADPGWDGADPDHGISRLQAARLAERILEERPEDNRVPEPYGGTSGVPQGYGKWGDLT